MGDLDMFSFGEGTDGAISAEKVREFQERMARNAQKMVAARQQEQKQKKKENKLSAILLKFIQTNTKPDITLLVSRCLEQNIPAVFILAIILLGNKDIQEEMGIHLQLKGDQNGEEATDEPLTEKEKKGRVQVSDLQKEEIKTALVAFGKNSALPLKMRLEIDLWGRSMFDAASPIPERILKTAVEFNEDPKALPLPKDVVIQLAAFILRDYFADHGVKQPFENVHNFAEFLMKGLMVKLNDQVEGQRQIGGK